MPFEFCHQFHIGLGLGLVRQNHSGLVCFVGLVRMKLMNKYRWFPLLFLTLLASQSFAGLLFNYSQLSLKDLDQMTKLVTDKIAEAKKAGSGRVVPLKEALQAVYSRPNGDEMIDKVVAPLRTQLDANDEWEKALSQLTDEAINALKNPKAFKPVVQVTYQIFLENLISEIRPLIGNEGFERALAVRIRDAKIQPSAEGKNERATRSMKAANSPSEIAGKILASTPIKPPSTEKDQATPSDSSSSEKSTSGK